MELAELVTLNVGCGSSPSGDVNCDLYIRDAGHRSHNKVSVDLKPERVRNFVVCDALHLPFKENCFRDVVCNHLIEHLERPVALMRELLRVSNHRVLIHCPHKLGDRLAYGEYDVHVGFFNRSWFVAVAEKLGVYCVTRVSRSFLLVIPLELEVEMWKK